MSAHGHSNSSSVDRERKPFLDERPLDFARPEEIARVIDELKLQLPDVVYYLNALTICRLGNIDSDNRTCPICREDFTNDGYTLPADSENRPEVPLRMTCGHIFGNRCITAWLARNNGCPYCRKELFPQLPSIRTEDGIRCRLGFLEFTMIRQPLDAHDEAVKAWLQRRLEEMQELSAQPDGQEERARESYGDLEDEFEDDLEEGEILEEEEDVGWYRHRNQRIYSTELEETSQTLEEDVEADNETENTDEEDAEEQDEFENTSEDNE